MLQFSTTLLAILLLSACTRTPQDQNANFRHKTFAFPSGEQANEDISPISSGLQDTLPKEESPDVATTPSSNPDDLDESTSEEIDIPEVVVVDQGNGDSPTKNSESQENTKSDETPAPEKQQDEKAPEHVQSPEQAPTLPVPMPDPSQTGHVETTTPKTPDVIEPNEDKPADEVVESDSVDDTPAEEAPAETKLEETNALLAEFSRFNPRFRLTLSGRDQEERFFTEKADLSLSPEKDALYFPTMKNVLHFKSHEGEKIRDDYALVAVVRPGKKSRSQTIARLTLSSKEEDVPEETKDKKDKDAKKAKKEAKDKDKDKDKEKNKKTKKQNFIIEVTVQKDRPTVRIVEKANGKNKKPIVLRPKFKLKQSHWSFLAVTFVGDEMHMYVGNKLLGKTKVALGSHYEKTELVIGALNKNGKNLWEGEIAELHLYDGVPAIFRGE